MSYPLWVKDASDVQALVVRAQAQTVPAENSDSVLGLEFNQVGYEQLLTDAKIDLGEEKMKGFADFDVLMPCCGFDHTFANLPDNCQCGHHLASYGVIKKMLLAGMPRQQIQLEANRWINYFFPKEAVAKELKSSSLSPNNLNAALKYLNTKGGC